jgi:tape measure domain-containing protein
MSGIDERVVGMKFDNAQFEAGVKQSLGTMDKLNQSLQLKGASKGFDEVGKAASRLSLQGIAAGVEDIKNKFSAMGVAGVAALATITTKAVNAGIQLAKSLTIAPIAQGFAEYNTTLGSIQTILANTGLTGQAGLNKVNAALQDLNTYSDKTIYNFSEMARNIGTFTAAGVKLNVATGAIKGIANLAAVSGSTAEQASTAMYQLSQAISTGTVKLQDWNSVVNAGMGGKVFQEALKRTARNHGVAVDAIIKKEGSFRASLQTGWLSSKILTDTLNQFTGDMTNAQLKQMGYTDQQIKAIQKMAKTAQEAATKVKTLPQLINTLQEAVGSGWANTFTILVGNFNQAKDLFTGINNVVGGYITANAKARNDTLKTWAALGGRADLLRGFGNIFKAIIGVIKPIRDAFREIFPAKTGAQLAAMTKSFADFTEHLKIGGPAAEALKSTFKGLFAIFDIGAQVLKGVVKFILSFFTAAQKGSGGILQLTGGIGDLVSAFDNWLKKGNLIGGFFDGLIAGKNRVIDPIMKAFQALGDIIGSVFSGIGGAGNPLSGLTGQLSGVMPVLSKIGDVAKNVFDALTGSLDNMASIATTFAGTVKEIFNPFKKAAAAVQSINAVNASFNGAAATGDKVKSSWQQVVDAFKAIGDFFKPVVSAIEGVFSAIKTKIKDFVSNMGIQDGLAVINTGFFIAFYAMLRSFIGSLKKVSDAGAKVLNNFSGILGQVQKNLKSMQTEIRAKTILEIAAAIALLAGAIYLLSKIDPKNLGASLGAVTVLVGELVGALVILQKNVDIKSSISLTALSGAFIAMAGALVLMAGAVALLGQLDASQIGKGLGAIVGLMAAITGMVTVLSKTGGGVTMVLAATGMAILAGALITFAGAVLLYDKIDAGKIADGTIKIALMLAALGLAFRAFPTNMILTAAGLAIVSFALVGIVAALEAFGHMSVKEIAKGLITLGAAMGILAVAMNLMTGAVGGAAAMLVMATALAIFVPVLATLGSLPLKVIAIGLGALVATFAILGVAGALLAPIVPVLMGLGAAIALLGLGAAAAGAGVFLFAAGLTALAAAGAVGATAALAAIEVILQALPLMAQQLGLAFVAFAKVIGDSAGPLMAALGKLLVALIDMLIKALPKVGQLISKLIDTVLGILEKAVPRYVVAAANIILGILRGLTQKLPLIVNAAGDLIVAFITAMGKNTVKVVKAGGQMIIDTINGIATVIRTQAPQLRAAGANLASAIIEGMLGGITGGASRIKDAIGNMAQSALDKAKSVLGIFSPSREFAKLGKYVVLGFAQGINGNADQMKTAYSTLKSQLQDTIKSSQQDVDQLTAKLKKLKSARDEDVKAIRATAAALATARSEHAKSTKALSLLTKQYTDDTIKLEGLARSYDAVATKLKAATQVLTDAQKTRDDFAKSTTDQFDNLPDLLPDAESLSPLEDFANSLRKQIADVQVFTTTLQKLRDLGLNDSLYKQLLAKGPSAQPFIDQLLAGGKDQVMNLDALSNQLDAAAGDLGKSAANSLYQAGVDAAQGIVDGLKKQEAAINAQMDKIALAMLTAIKKALGIKSPSKEMAKVGSFAGEGVVQGLSAMSGAVNKQAAGMGKDAILALQKSIAGISEFILTDDLMSPVITPVLDLSQATTDAAKLSDILAKTPVAVGASYSAAKSADAGYQANAEALAAAAVPVATTDVTYNQYNNSPKALSTADVYRGTSNQLSVLKKGLPGAQSS